LADIFDVAKRSEVMSRIRGSGTSIEKRLFAIVRETLGPRRRMVRNAKSLPGKPDVFVPALSLALFADGCFFHQCPAHGHIPKSNALYWEPKLTANATRDARHNRELRAQGISVWRFWEHHLEGARLKKTTLSLASRLAAREFAFTSGSNQAFSDVSTTNPRFLGKKLLLVAEARARYNAGPIEPDDS